MPKTTTTYQYAPGSLERFGEFQGGLQDYLQQWQDNPFMQANVQQAYQMGQHQLDQEFLAQNQQYLNNAVAMGMVGSTAGEQAGVSELAKRRRMLSHSRSGLKQNLLLGAIQQGMQAQGLGGMLQPTQTGQTVKKKTSMLGKIGKVAGMVAPFALAPFTGGLSLAGLAAPMAGGATSTGQIPPTGGLNFNTFTNPLQLNPGQYTG